MFIGSPSLRKDGTYTLYSGGTSTGTKASGLYDGGEYKDGNKIVEFKISSIVTWLNQTGVTTGRTGNMGGPGGMPGQGGGGGGGRMPSDGNRPMR